MGEMSRIWDALFQAHQAGEWKKEAALREKLVTQIRADLLTEVQDTISVIERTLIDREDDHGAAVVSWCINEIGSVQ